MTNSLAPALVLGALLALTADTPAQRGRPTGSRPLQVSPGPELWVSGYDSEALHRFGATSGDQRPPLPGIAGAQSVQLGPDGLYYVVAEKVNQVLRYRLDRLVDVFVGDDPGTSANEAGPLDGPTSAVFGPDGSLYVGSFHNDRVLRYDGQSGAYRGVFVRAGSGSLDGPDAGMTFGPDGHLYVPSFHNDRVLRYDGGTGADLGGFVSPRSGGLRNPRMLLFRPGGNLWVSSWGSNRILEFDSTGGFLREIVSVTRPTGFAVSPFDGDLYVTSDQTNRVNRFDLLTGERVEIFVPAAAGVDGATFLTFVDRY